MDVEIVLECHTDTSDKAEEEDDNLDSNCENDNDSINKLAFHYVGSITLCENMGI